MHTDQAIIQIRFNSDVGKDLSKFPLTMEFDGVSARITLLKTWKLGFLGCCMMVHFIVGDGFKMNIILNWSTKGNLNIY